VNALSRLAERQATALTLAAIVVLWEIAREFQLVASGALPAPSDVLIRFWQEQSDYWPHVAATIQTAFAGFLAGNVIAIAAAILFVRWPLTERLGRGVNIAIFALPPIAIVPVLVLALPGEWPRITLAALTVYFPTMTAMVVGLTEIDGRAVELVRAYGGGDTAVMLDPAAVGLAGSPRWLTRRRPQCGARRNSRRVRQRRALGAGHLPARLARPRRSGTALGHRLDGDGDRRPRLCPGGTGRLARHRGQACCHHCRRGDAGQRASRSGAHRLVVGLAALLLPFVIWWLLLPIGGLSPISAKTPLGVFQYLFLPPTGTSAQIHLLEALMQTLPIMVLGMAAGLSFAFLLAVIGSIKPAILRALMPIALVTQTMPLVALTPLLVLVFGRGFAVTVGITVSVTFFPAYVTLARGLLLVPPG
jgi:ABC-type nitrate/sulfonate/bicarbonate transport system permease component